ncbi:hypothetical protein O3G_MSEX005901 [Manduca sexta]|uniref:Eukaryotic translation initiation factor 4 gamma 3-like n=1 Tax=Manduca sexta TaxID=7130 RepID=A0A921Z1A1_MANSE|nr:hypothetical protein O3G_MSEX005901 [Manduca sexta]
MSMILSPLFWEWFNIWLIQFLKDLYHEIKMVALRGNNNSNNLSHACISHGNQSQQRAMDVAQSLQTSLNMPQSSPHINVNQINLQSLNNVSLQFIPQQTNASSLKHEPSSSRYTNSNCVVPAHHYRLLTQSRPVECYHPSGASGTTYLPSTSGGSQSSAQTSLRVQPTPQPSAPPAPQQDMSKNTMSGHNYVSQNQSQQQRPQYQNYQYRAPQHNSRPSTHPRQQQPFIPGTAAPTGPVMYPLMFQPTHVSLQTYQQPRSGTQYHYPYVSYIQSYNTPPGPSPQYYYPSTSPQLPTQNPQGNAQGRSNPTTLVGLQGTPATATAPSATIPHPQAPTHMHQPMPGMQPAVQKRPSHRLAIIHPDTNKDILSDMLSNDNYVTSDSSDRHTPQPESTHSVVEEFNRRVSEVANQPSDSVTKANYTSKSVELPISSTMSSMQPPQNPTSNHNHAHKSETLNINESKSLGGDVIVEHNETPIVSAISDSPVIVPKMPISIKQLQKNSDQTIQSLVLDTNKNIQPNHQHKGKSMPQNDDIEKPPDSISTNVVDSSTSPSVVSAGPAPVLAPSHTNVTSNTQVPSLAAAAPQPQRIREPRERVKSEEKDKNKDSDTIHEKETPPTFNKPNGSSSLAISSVDSLLDTINPLTSQSNQAINTESKKNLAPTKQLSPAPESKNIAPAESKAVPTKSEQPAREVTLTATELLSASIEKLVKEKPQPESKFETKETSSAIEAQVKLTQSLSSVLRNNQAESKMKDTNLNNKTMDADTANGNGTELNKTETAKEDINKNEKVVKNTKNSNKKSNKMATSEVHLKETESYENGKDETDKVVNVEKNVQEETKQNVGENKEAPPALPVFVPKYKYSEDQWSPFNKTGKKCYDIDFLMQIKDDPLSKNKPDAPLLEACNVIRTAPMQEPLPFSNISRPMNDSLFPPFLKGSGMGSRNNTPREMKKEGRNMTPSGRGSMKLPSTPSGSSPHKPLISIILRDDVKLNEVDSAWKPNRFRQETLTEEEQKTQELYKKFRGILNKLTPQKFDTLLDKVKTLEINNQKRLEGVIDLVFEKAIDEPNFSEAYAAMCNKLSKLKVPADNPTTPDQCVNFRALIINKCQNQFVTDKVDAQVMKLEKEIAECTDPVKKKELQLMLEDEHRRVRRRSVGNVRFIGELYKLKMLTSKIMDYCMKYLIDKLDEEKLECLCKLLTTIGEQIENEVHGQLDIIFKKMQEIVDRKSHQISSRVKFMIQDVILLRRRKWVVKSVVDSQPKMMDQIQKEAEQQQRQIELINASPMGGGFRRDEGGRGKRGDGRRQNSNNSYMDNTWKPSRANFPVDTSKLKAASQKSLSNIKLAPHNSGWNHGSGTKNTAQTAGSNTSMINLSKNMYSVLENVQTDPTSLRGTRDMTPSYHSKGASIERSTFNSRGDIMSGGGNRSGSVGVARSNSGTRSTSAALPVPTPPTDAQASNQAAVLQEPLPEAKKKSVKCMIELRLINPDDDEMVADVKQLFQPQYHAAVVSEIFKLVLEKSAKDIGSVAKSLFYLVSTNTISPDNFLNGIKETFEFAPDLYIDIPMLYDYLGKLITPHIEKKHITFVQVFRLCDTVISSNQGHLFLRALIRDLKESMGPTFVKSKWQESELQLKQWMEEDQIAKWIEENKFEFLEGNVNSSEETKKILTPAETKAKLLQLMNADESSDCIKGWVQDKIGKASNDDWFMRALIQAICEHAFFGPEGRDVPHFNQDRMTKYASLIQDFGETKQSREASCLFGIQQLIHRLEHPQGLTLEIFQYLHEQYIISLEGFFAWEESEKEPEGKGVLMKTLTSFFTNIKEADNEDSSED